MYDGRIVEEEADSVEATIDLLGHALERVGAGDLRAVFRPERYEP